MYFGLDLIYEIDFVLIHFELPRSESCWILPLNLGLDMIYEIDFDLIHFGLNLIPVEFLSNCSDLVHVRHR